MECSAADVAAVRRVTKTLPLWDGHVHDADKDIHVSRLEVVSANKILVAECHGLKVLVKFPMQNLFSMVFDLSEQKMVNDMVSQYRGDRGLNPKVLHVGTDCRVDEFVPCRTLQQSDYADMATMEKLAVQLATLHNDCALKEAYIAIKGGEVHTIAVRLRGMQETFQKNFPRRKANVATQVPKAHWPLARRVNDAMEILADACFFDDLLAKCFVVPDPAALVFSHNDLSANNVLKRTDMDGAVQIIDFDGSNLSYRGADIGYMIKNMEMHGMAWDPSSLAHFVDCYLAQCAADGIVVVDKAALMDEIARGKVLALVFLMTMFGASDNWDVFHLTGFGFLDTFPGFMETIVAFASTAAGETPA
ncbi:Aste57867_791 [Aphanomyces stellatus]|uniref:Aste57867_791 protein n=1 Tax=Aphanomyces stellatus TaxID=120398 RepID=A0A485K3U0_9STRA|nr:hypothetical protein As57867_000790 [Aphanomyces stellatus]VFT78015.1 Aste57867_791 [Aphanomyces stellatus]